MSDEGERTCPLCAEEMDLTDQQLKPCKCGYEICVWCWHHVMDMAEKDETEGRCPACRSPYDKEKIVGMAAKCERLVAEISIERKKSQKARTNKSTEGRKQLSSVRVIQRNLVYIVGLPLNLADEDLLQRREYFAQYGKVLKVSMSRTAAGVIQQFPNNTCSVYITYSKEEEAIRCIQNVHGFSLDGRSLRACFGTTKYCHAWLRNVPCSNPDCLYLHEIGSQEDSFTKDEIISAYTRSRVQQITGAAINMQRRSGSMLPPPAEEYCSNSSASTGKPIVKNTLSNTASIIRGSPPNGSPGRSIALPAAAAWGMRGSNCQPPSASISCSNGPSNQKPDTVGSTLAVAGATQASTLHTDAGKMPTLNEEVHTIHSKSKPEVLKSLKQHISVDSRTNPSEILVTPDGTPASLTLSSELSSSKDNDRGISMPLDITNYTDHNGQPCSSVPEKLEVVASDGQIQNLCSDISSISIDKISRNEHSVVIRPNSTSSDNVLVLPPGNQGLQQHYAEQYREPVITRIGKGPASVNGMYVSREESDWRLDSHTQVAQNTFSEVEEDILSFDSQRLKDPEVVSRSNTYLPNSANSLQVSNLSRSHSLQPSDAFGTVSVNADHHLSVDNKVSDSSLLHASSISVISNGFPENLVSSVSGSSRTLEHSSLLPNEEKGKHTGRFPADAANGDGNADVDKGESSIISDILSMDFDSWNDSFASPQNLAKLLGDTDQQSGSLKISSSWKAQNNNQSRFSFARHEESKSQAFDLHPSFNVNKQLPKNHSFIQDFAERDLYMDKLGIGNGFSSRNFEESEYLATSHPVMSPNKFSGVSRAQISAPPGFSVPSRAPPPGFSSNERLEQAFDPMSGNHLLETPSLLRNSYQVPPTGNISNSADIEFMDPAILAVGKGRLQGGLNNPGLDMRSTFPPQLSAFENEARLQLLMQRSLSPQQNLRYSDIGDSFSHRNDSYGISSRLVDQSQMSNLSPFAQLSLQQSRNAPHISNGHWDGWNEVQGGNSLGMAELLRNDRLGYNKFYNGYEESKYRMPNSGDLYNRTFGM